MKIIYITPDPPLPPSGGGVRSYQILSKLVEMGEVDVFVLRHLTENQLNTIKDLKVSCFFPYQTRESDRKNSFRKLLSPFIYFFPFLSSKKQLSDEVSNFAFQRHKYFPNFLKDYVFKWLKYWIITLKVPPNSSVYRMDGLRKIKEELVEHIEQKNYDVYFLDYSYIFPLIKNSLPKKARIVTNAHNIEYKILEQYTQAIENTNLKKYYKLQEDLMKIHELDGFKSSEHIYCCSIEDKNTLKLEGINDDKIKEIPNGVDTNFFMPDPFYTNDPSILFTGSFGYEPNVDAMLWFLKDIWPKLHLKIPSMKLIIAGRNAEILNNKIKIQGNVEIVNSPSDMRPFFNKAWIYIVPLRMGSGTRLKILEAWAMGKAVISTTKGVEGIIYENHTNILLANTETEMVNSIVLLIEEEKVRKKIAENGRSLAIQRYDWNVALEALNLDY